VYYCQNWRSDVSAIVTSGGAMKEWAKYSAYGVPQGLPFGDTDSDGDRDATDATQVQTWIDAPAYDVRGDADLDGDVDSTDKSTIQASTVTMGRGALSDVGNRRGYAGYEYDTKFRGKYHVRNRVLDPYLGRWLRRDLEDYLDSHNLYEYVKSLSLVMLDPDGLKSCFGIGCTTGGGLPVSIIGSPCIARLKTWNAAPAWQKYGNWCGPGSNGCKPPIDDGGTDACCKTHDMCWKNSYIIPLPNMECENDPRSAEQKVCDCDFGKCLKAATPKAGSREERANNGAQALFGQCCED
jgi:RHS repeat-associated protein